MADIDDIQVDNPAFTPSWLSDFGGKAWSRVLGTVKQSVLEAARAAIFLRFPGYCPPDALVQHALERNLDMGYGENQARLSARVKKAWATWALAGTRAGMIEAFTTAGMSNITIYESADAPALRWWEFDIIVRPPFPWPGVTVADIPDSYKSLIRQLVKKWKPTHAVCRLITIAVYAETWDERQARRGTWDASPNEAWGEPLFFITNIV